MDLRTAAVAAAATVIACGSTVAAAPKAAVRHAPAPATVTAAHGPPAKGTAALDTAARIQTLLRQADALRAQNTAVPSPPAATRAVRERALRGDGAAVSARADATPGPQTGTSDSQDPSAAATTLVPGPVTDAVAHICGNVTICGVWWAGAVGDREAYQSCMLHSTAAAAADLDFGTSSAEYCSSLYGGDCDDAGAGSELGELCSLVPGVAAQWSPDYAFSRIVTSGDCAHYKTVALPEKNVLGLRLDPSQLDAAKVAAGQPPHLVICTAKLYLRLTQ